jgi:hypothetical protein
MKSHQIKGLFMVFLMIASSLPQIAIAEDCETNKYQVACLSQAGFAPPDDFWQQVSPSDAPSDIVADALEQGKIPEARYGEVKWDLIADHSAVKNPQWIPASGIRAADFAGKNNLNQLTKEQLAFGENLNVIGDISKADRNAAGEALKAKAGLDSSVSLAIGASPTYYESGNLIVKPCNAEGTRICELTLDSSIKNAQIASTSVNGALGILVTQKAVFFHPCEVTWECSGPADAGRQYRIAVP